MRVDLDRATSKSSWFRIMPRFKVRAEGEPVRMGDQVIGTNQNVFRTL